MKPFTRIASVIFGAIAVLHFLRIAFFHVDVIVDKLHIPLWVSVMGFIVTGILSVGLWKESNSKL